MKTRLFACVAVLAALNGSTALAQQDDSAVGSLAGGAGGRQQQRIDVDVQDVDLAEVMEQIGRQVGRNILVDPNVQERITVSLRDISWREAVDVIARMARCEVEDREGGILVLTQPPKVTIQFTDANVRTVLQLLSAYSGKNIIISPDVRGTVTLDLKEVHWLRALHAIVKTVGDYEVVEETEDLLRIVSRSSIEQQLETVVFPLRYVRPPAHYRAVPPRQSGQSGGGAAAAVFVGPAVTAAPVDPTVTFTLYRALRSVITSSQINGATLEYDSTTNVFIVTATRPLINQLETIIKKLDTQPAQLFAEVKFVATVDNEFQKYGIEFNEGEIDNGLRILGPFAPQGISQTTFRVSPTIDADARPNSGFIGAGQYPFLFGEGGGSFAEPFYLPAIMDLGGLNMSMDLIQRNSRSRIVQSPSLFMMDNQDAVIFVGENVPYATFNVSQDANGNQQQTIAEGADSPVAVGFSLFVQPHIVPDSDRINLTVIPRVNELTGTTSPTIPGFDRFAFGGNNQFLDLPRTREQALVTQIMLDDTNTAVLGGLLTERNVEIQKRIPILSSLPIIGNLFIAKQFRSECENLTIFLTPTIIRERGTVNSIFGRSTRRLEQTDYFYRTQEAGLDDEDEVDFHDDEKDGGR